MTLPEHPITTHEALAKPTSCFWDYFFCNDLQPARPTVRLKVYDLAASAVSPPVSASIGPQRLLAVPGQVMGGLQEAQMSSISRLGSSMMSFTRFRNVTASRPSMSLWS